MSSQPSIPAHGPDQRAADAQHFRAVLHDLVDLGASLAREVHGAAVRAVRAEPASAAAPGRVTTPDRVTPLVAAFDRLARTVRRTILLAQRVAEPPPPDTRAAARRRILREVEDAIIRKPRPPGEADSLRAELHERLDAPELAETLDGDLAQHPVAAVIADICRDLGLADMPFSPPWPRRTPQDVAALCARAAQRTAPAAPMAAPAPRPASRTAPTPMTTPVPDG